MSKSAEGIVEKAFTYRGLVRAKEFVQVILMSCSDEPIPNAKCKVTFEDGQTIEVESNDKGILRFEKKAEGEVEIEILEEEENTTESNEEDK
jgi:hypothetical protein